MIKIGNVKAGRVRIYKFDSFKALTKKENDIRNDKDKGNDYLLEEIAKNEKHLPVPESHKAGEETPLQ